MFGFDTSLWMIRDIILILSEQEEAISSKQLLNLLGYSNSSKLKKLCSALQRYIQESYSENEFELIISTRNGIRLKSDPSRNAQNLLSFIASKDLAFAIYQAVLLDRTVSTKDFCKEHFISISTLQRRIKKINADINNYGLHLTFSQKKFSIQGKESTIRSFTFILLYIKNRQISNAFEIENHTHYLDLSTKIADYLGITFRCTQQESFSLFLFVFEMAIQRGHSFSFAQEEVPGYSELHFPKQPAFLNWHEEEWQFLLLITFSSNIVNYEIPVDTSDFHSEKIATVVTEWIACFERYFSIFDYSQRDFLYQTFLKKYFFNYFFTVDDALLQVFPTINLQLIERTQPFYMHRFNMFWHSFSKQCPSYNKIALKAQSFLLCQHFFPLKEAFPTVKLYVFTDLTVLSFYRIQDNLVTFFLNKYKISFVSNWELADVIIGTIDFREKKLLENQLFIMIRIQLTTQDLIHIDEEIEKLMLKKYRITTDFPYE